ncbi:MAG: PIN domain-containing protein [Rectinemataceae bacterium]
MVLVDSSVWIAFFKGTMEGNDLFGLIDTNTICINDLILSELVPSLKLRKEDKLIDIFESVEKLVLDINWKELISFQTYNLKHGINRIGLPDLIIAQNAIQNDVKLYSLDKHFGLMKKHLGLKIYGE